MAGTAAVEAGPGGADEAEAPVMQVSGEARQRSLDVLRQFFAARKGFNKGSRPNSRGPPLEPDLAGPASRQSCPNLQYMGSGDASSGPGPPSRAAPPGGQSEARRAWLGAASRLQQQGSAGPAADQDLSVASRSSSATSLTGPARPGTCTGFSYTRLMQGGPTTGGGGGGGGGAGTASNAPGRGDAAGMLPHQGEMHRSGSSTRLPRLLQPADGMGMPPSARPATSQGLTPSHPTQAPLQPTPPSYGPAGPSRHAPGGVGALGSALLARRSGVSGLGQSPLLSVVTSGGGSPGCGSEGSSPTGRTAAARQALGQHGLSRAASSELLLQAEQSRGDAYAGDGGSGDELADADASGASGRSAPLLLTTTGSLQPGTSRQLSSSAEHLMQLPSSRSESSLGVRSSGGQVGLSPSSRARGSTRFASSVMPAEVGDMGFAVELATAQNKPMVYRTSFTTTGAGAGALSSPGMSLLGRQQDPAPPTAGYATAAQAAAAFNSASPPTSESAPLPTSSSLPNTLIGGLVLSFSSGGSLAGAPVRGLDREGVTSLEDVLEGYAASAESMARLARQVQGPGARDRAAVTAAPTKGSGSGGGDAVGIDRAAGAAQVAGSLTPDSPGSPASSSNSSAAAKLDGALRQLQEARAAAAPMARSASSSSMMMRRADGTLPPGGAGAPLRPSPMVPGDDWRLVPKATYRNRTVQKGAREQATNLSSEIDKTRLRHMLIKEKSTANRTLLSVQAMRQA